MDEQAVDVVVVGLGPGGEHASIKLAEAGLDVVAIEERLVGGECPYYGCVPSKMMIAAAHSLGEARRIPGRAGSVETSPDWSPVATRIREEATDDWDDTAAVERLRKAGAAVVKARGRLAGPGRVEADGTTYVARRGVLLNPGTAPASPPIDGLAESPYWTNRDVVRLEQLPASLIVLGGGAIGVELAQALHRFGVDVTIVESAEHLVAVEEPEAGEMLGRRLAEEGIQVLTGASTEKVTYTDGRFTLHIGERPVTADRLLVATGRRPNLSDLGLERVGLDPDAKTLGTDERMRAAEGLWAVGDVTGKGMFTHVSMYQAAVAVRDILGEDGPWADYRAVPRVTFADPEVGAVGLTEKQAREAGIDVRTGMSPDLGARGWIAQQPGLVKLVADAGRGVLVGGTVVGAAGGEILSMLATAVHAQVPVDTLRGMHFAYPTFHRAVETALADLELGVAPS
jgi:pyruvate/2-oxoglutarate dehydrogenase complex dihydrolipoamide dehydrogenase (E3) component